MAKRPKPSRRVPGAIATPHPGRGDPVTYAPPAPLPLGVYKPILRNTRDIQRVMIRQLNRTDARLERWLVSTINAQRSAIKFEEIRNALATGQIQQSWLTQWQRSYTELVNTRIVPELISVAQTAGLTYTAIGADSGFQLPYTRMRLFADEWIARRGAELVTRVTDSQRQAIQGIMRIATQEQWHPNNAERYLRPIVGLDAPSARAVQNRRAALLESGLTEDQAARRAQRYADRLVRVRAKRIARTESAMAWNYAQNELINQAQIAGNLGDVIAEWYTALDERVCDYCGPLHGTRIPMGGMFTVLDGPSATPPAHPNCRCFLIYHATEG